MHRRGYSWLVFSTGLESGKGGVETNIIHVLPSPFVDGDISFVQISTVFNSVASGPPIYCCLLCISAGCSQASPIFEW